MRFVRGCDGQRNACSSFDPWRQVSFVIFPRLSVRVPDEDRRTKMQKRTICPLTCPMINAQGFCESAWRRAGQMRECPHDRLRRKTRRKRKK